ncbi:hypothetical protein PENSTE_c006G01446 [Penicillium steckii]|uniref:Heterokaryon incompatibility domain-containing protein n=1 Tax=Penicillium steckii TaxID=303698 RepID=A0A1V6TGT8_9EURO|nr:hypothetical protein PENSTE_c006G01446 [Penicillium steckii]
MQSPSSLCSRCKVLQFNDEEHGRVPKHPSSAEMQVTYNKFDDNTSYDVDWEDILICKTQGIFLDYDLLDEFPDLPVLSRSSAAGCGMCTAMHSCSEWLRIMREPFEDRPFSEGWMTKLQNLAKQAFSKSESQDKVRYVPTRLIDVGDANSESKIRLVIPNSHLPMASNSVALNGDRKYIALSYCWGREADAVKQLKTTTSSLEKNMENIAMNSLPKTIHDAVLLCRVLGVRYLWVDALCIIQDDRDDWERESSEMAQIYESSCFTLCDLQGNSCQSGFLKESKRDLIKIPFQSSFNPSISGHFYICNVPSQYDKVFDNSLFETHPDNEALWKDLHLAFSKKTALDRDLEKSRWNTRGWTFQEALSSPLLLLFGDRMFHFVALQEQRSQDGSFSFECHPWGQSFHWDALSSVKSLSSDGWRRMAERFSYRDFSLLQDRLPAMSALARKSASETTGQYLAGIWGGQLETDLLWVPLARKSLVSFLRPLKQYLAPSWSWACQYGPVTWPRPRLINVGRPELSPGFQIVSMNTVTGLDKYGRVQSGFISLETKICELPSTKVHRRRPVKFREIELPYELYSANGEYIAHLRLDWTHYANKFHQDSQELQKQEDDNLVALLSMVLIRAIILDRKSLSSMILTTQNACLAYLCCRLGSLLNITEQESFSRDLRA